MLGSARASPGGGRGGLACGTAPRAPLLLPGRLLVQLDHPAKSCGPLRLPPGPPAQTQLQAAAPCSRGLLAPVGWAAASAPLRAVGWLAAGWQTQTQTSGHAGGAAAAAGGGAAAANSRAAAAGGGAAAAGGGTDAGLGPCSTRGAASEAIPVQAARGCRCCRFFSLNRGQLSCPVDCCLGPLRHAHMPSSCWAGSLRFGPEDTEARRMPTAILRLLQSCACSGKAALVLAPPRRAHAAASASTARAAATRARKCIGLPRT